MNLARSAIALLILVMLALPLSAWASCSLSGRTETVTMTVSPSTVTIDPNAAVGTVLASSTVATPSPSNSQVTCTGNSTTIGVMNSTGAGQPNGSSTIYPTGVAGVGYRLLHDDSSYYLPPFGFDSIASGTYNLSVGTAVQLVKTGPITGGSTLASGQLGFWQYTSRNGTFAAENFMLANSVKFVQPTCTVNTANISVTLPTVSNTALTTTGATAGATAFNVGLTCSAAAAGQDMAIQFDTNSQPAGTTGVIKLNASSTAKNVGVQLVDSTFQPVTFGTAQDAGTTPTGVYNLTYYARYYALANNAVTAGTVSATATFTISYP